MRLTTVRLEDIQGEGGEKRGFRGTARCQFSLIGMPNVFMEQLFGSCNVL